MFDTVILSILALLHLISLICSWSVLKNLKYSYGNPNRFEQVTVVIISGLILLVVGVVIIERHVRIV